MEKKRYLGKWEKTKLLVRGRDKDICQMCGLVWAEQTKYKTRFDVHHILPEQDGWLELKFTDVSPDVLITLCRKCHMNIKKVDYKLLLEKVKVIKEYKKQI